MFTPPFAVNVVKSPAVKLPVVVYEGAETAFVNVASVPVSVRRGAPLLSNPTCSEPVLFKTTRPLSRRITIGWLLAALFSRHTKPDAWVFKLASPAVKSPVAVKVGAATALWNVAAVGERSSRLPAPS